MESLVQMFESQAKDGRTIVLTFFFNAYGVGQLQKSAMGMYRSLLYQLMEKSSHALAKFRRLYERRKLAEAQGDDGFLFHRNELSKFLTSTLESAVMRTKVTIFIDAIDEAVEGREEVIKFLGRLDKRLRGLRPNTSMCFSCRHHPIITASDKHEVAMEVENLADITTYVNLELEQCALVAREILERTGDLARLKDEIIKRACGLFLWAFLVIPHVERLLNSGMSVNNVLLTLDQAPTRLGEVYADILRNVIHEDDRSIALTLMKWASFTSPPLYLTRLSQEVDFIKVGDIQNKYETLVDNEEQILEIRVGNFSGGLLEVTKEHDLGAAIFIHPTAKRFLKEEGLSLLRRLLRGSSARSSFASTSASSTPSKDTSKVLVDRVDPVICKFWPLQSCWRELILILYSISPAGFPRGYFP